MAATMKRALVVLFLVGVLAACSSGSSSSLRNEVRTRLTGDSWSTCAADYQASHLDKHTMQTFLNVAHLVQGTSEAETWNATAAEAAQACGGTIEAHRFNPYSS